MSFPSPPTLTISASAPYITSAEFSWTATALPIPVLTAASWKTLCEEEDKEEEDWDLFITLSFILRSKPHEPFFAFVLIFFQTMDQRITDPNIPMILQKSLGSFIFCWQVQERSNRELARLNHRSLLLWTAVIWYTERHKVWVVAAQFMDCCKIKVKIRKRQSILDNLPSIGPDKHLVLAINHPSFKDSRQEHHRKKDIPFMLCPRLQIIFL